MSLALFASALTAMALTTGAAAASTGVTAPAAATVDASLPSGSAEVRSGAWSWPLQPVPAVVAAFDPPEDRWGRGHRGLDLAAQVGQQVLSPADGQVSFAGTIAGRGVVVVAHAGGLRSTFEPVREQVPLGTSVEGGDVIAALDETPGHCAPATCLHWGVLRGDTYLDPLSFLTRRPIVLLPLH